MAKDINKMTDQERFEEISKFSAKIVDDHNKKHGTTWQMGVDGKKVDRKTGKPIEGTDWRKRSPKPKKPKDQTW